MIVLHWYTALERIKCKLQSDHESVTTVKLDVHAKKQNALSAAVTQDERSRRRYFVME